MRKKILQQKKLLNVLQFFLVFNLLALPMYFVLLTDTTFPPLQNFLAAITAQVLQFQKISATSSGPFITIIDVENNLRNIEISFDSTGWKSLYALAALVVATPLSGLQWKLQRKFRFLAVALPAVFLLNFLRIWSTLWYSYVFGWQNFDVIHTLLWREGLIAVVLLFWFFWLRDAVKLRKRKEE